MEEIEIPPQLNNEVLYPAFVYDEYRCYEKFCLFSKMIAFTFYTMTTVDCMNQPSVSWFFIMLIGMLASMCNTIRYEYAFHKKYGTVFESIDEFNQWKLQQNPHVKVGLDLIEFAIKLVIFFKSIPFRLDIHEDKEKTIITICSVGTMILKLHIMVLMVLYSMLICLFGCTYFNFQTHHQPPVVLNAINPTNALLIISSINPNALVIDNETECCICLEKNENHWITADCTHAFHATCILEWKQINQSCPICRSNLILPA